MIMFGSSIGFGSRSPPIHPPHRPAPIAHNLVGPHHEALPYEPDMGPTPTPTPTPARASSATSQDIFRQPPPPLPPGAGPPPHLRFRLTRVQREVSAVPRRVADQPAPPPPSLSQKKKKKPPASISAAAAYCEGSRAKQTLLRLSSRHFYSSAAPAPAIRDFLRLVVHVRAGSLLSLSLSLSLSVCVCV